MAAEKIEQLFSLGAAGPEVDVADKQAAKAPFGTRFTHG
jgi:hypothetical protein